MPPARRAPASPGTKEVLREELRPWANSVLPSEHDEGIVGEPRVFPSPGVSPPHQLTPGGHQRLDAVPGNLHPDAGDGLEDHPALVLVRARAIVALRAEVRTRAGL